MKLDKWLELNERTRPIFKEVTDDFVKVCEESPNGIMVRMARLMGLPEGVDPMDFRILTIFKVEMEN